MILGNVDSVFVFSVGDYSSVEVALLSRINVETIYCGRLLLHMNPLVTLDI